MSFLRFQRITKRFPGVLALDNVSFDVEGGHCHAIMGENGAGKSTLGKILAGVYRPDAGQILLEGRLIDPSTPVAAKALGIAMVHQELAFCPNLSVAENLCLGNLPGRGGWVDRRAVRKRAQSILKEIGADIDVNLPMGQLSTGQEQMVQIAGAIGADVRVIIMDEPTSSLSAHESEQLFRLLRELKERRLTVLYVSHRMEEIFRLCDTLTVLRDGQHVATEGVTRTSSDRVVQQMIGRDVVAFDPTQVERPLQDEVLRVRGLESRGKFSNISFDLRRGEILGFAGLVGAGRSEIAEAVFGADPSAMGQVLVHGRPLSRRSISGSLDAGLGLLPEDRKRQGLILSMNCRENVSLASLNRLTCFGFVRRKAEDLMVKRYADQLRVKTPSLDAPISGLSGGNQQKIALAKWLARQCDILIVDEPTRGIDVGAKAEIHSLLDDLARRGMAIWLISSELPELMKLSRRIIVLREGQIMGELSREDFSRDALMRLMAGIDRACP